MATLALRLTGRRSRQRMMSTSFIALQAGSNSNLITRKRFLLCSSKVHLTRVTFSPSISMIGSALPSRVFLPLQMTHSLLAPCPQRLVSSLRTSDSVCSLSFSFMMFILVGWLMRLSYQNAQDMETQNKQKCLQAFQPAGTNQPRRNQ